MNEFLIKLAKIIFTIHIVWALFIIYGIFFRLPSLLLNPHLIMSALAMIAPIINECPLTTLERFIRKKAGQKLVRDRGSLFLGILEDKTGIKLPQVSIRIFGFFLALFGMLVHYKRFF